MKKPRMLALLLAACIGLSQAPAAGLTIEAQAASSTSSAKKAAKKSGLVREKGKYYYYSKGKKVKNTWKTIKKKKYYFGPDGAAKTGWYTISGTSYYFNSKGVMQPSKSKKISKSLVQKMDRILKKQKITYKTNPKTAVKTLFRYIRDNYKYARVIGFSAKDRWEYGYALDMMRSKAGSCYHFAAAYAFLVKRATGYPVRIGYGTSDAFRKGNFQPHAWCEIKIGNTWYTFDTNVAWAKKNNPDGVRLSSGKCYMQKRSFMVGKIYKNAKYVNVEL